MDESPVASEETGTAGRTSEGVTSTSSLVRHIFLPCLNSHQALGERVALPSPTPVMSLSVGRFRLVI